MKVISYFEDHKTVIEEQLLKAENEVLIAVAWINFDIYFDIFSDLLKKKVQLNIICSDNPSNRRYIEIIQNLRDQGAVIRLLKMPTIYTHMHHKFAIIDQITILNGSFNWSINAAKSFENLTVIEGYDIEARKFKREFETIVNIDTATIRKLQKISKCKNCGDGELLNVLVFSERSTKYYETFGDVVKACNNCFEYETIQECIQDTQLYILADNLNGVDNADEYSYLEDLLYKQLASYSSLDIHAIGKVKKTLNFRDEEDVETYILWKNKFVGERVPNFFEDDFGVYYDN